MINFQNNLDEEEIKREVTGEGDDLKEERLIGPQDEDDDDPSDTTPAEAEELSDEGGKIFEEERKRREHPDQLSR